MKSDLPIDSKRILNSPKSRARILKTGTPVETIKIYKGKTKKLKITVKGAKKLTAKSSNKKIVKVLKSTAKVVKIKAVKKGKATIKANAGGKTAKCRVVVK